MGDIAKKRLILALDLPSASEAVALAGSVKDHVGCFKIGLQLFLKEGRTVVEEVAKLGVPLFLDLKLHDIPATVGSAVRSLKGLPISMLTLHTGGGRAMLEAAVEAAATFPEPPLLLGVTLLTSLSEEDFPAVMMTGTASEVVRTRARLAVEAGVGGIVASPQEVKMLRELCPPAFKLVIPGIRLADSVADDQKRIATPDRAISEGADFLVVGRPIRASSDPAAAAAEVVALIEKGLGNENEQNT